MDVRLGGVDLARLDRLAQSQQDLFTRAQAADCGYSRKQIRRRLAKGEWQQVIGSVLAKAGVELAPGVLDRAAQLAVPGSVLAGPSAARCWGMAVPESPPCLAIAPSRHSMVAGIRFIRTPISRRDIGLSDGAACTSRARTIVDCLLVLSEPDAAELLDRALQRRWIDLEELAERVHQHVGRRGSRRLVRLLGRVSGGSWSAAERLAGALLRSAGITGWRTNMAIQDDNGIIGVADLVFDAERLIVEFDGWAFPAEPEQFQRDRQRQNRLVAAGWTVLRFTWRDLTEGPEHVITTIRAMRAQLAGGAQ